MGLPATVLIMARAPVPGRTKTRLEPLLGSAGCARLQAALIRQTVATATGAAPGAVVVAAAGDLGLLCPIVAPGVRVFAQSDGDLGRRMATACREVRAVRPGPVVVVGTDCPVLAREHLLAAVRRLAAGSDIVFGPAHDGGYYLVAHSIPDPAAVFDLPAATWGGPDVLARSVAAAAAAGLTVGVIRTEHDLDTVDDAERARADARVPRAIAALLAPGSDRPRRAGEHAC